jgi:hypothetical protein
MTSVYVVLERPAHYEDVDEAHCDAVDGNSGHVTVEAVASTMYNAMKIAGAVSLSSGMLVEIKRLAMNHSGFSVTIFTRRWYDNDEVSSAGSASSEDDEKAVSTPPPPPQKSGKRKATAVAAPRASKKPR